MKIYLFIVWFLVFSLAVLGSLEVYNKFQVGLPLRPWIVDVWADSHELQQSLYSDGLIADSKPYKMKGR